MPSLRVCQLMLGKSQKERDIRECAIKKQKTAALLFPLLITSICIVFGVKIPAKDKKIKNEGVHTARIVERIIGETAAATIPEHVAVTITGKVAGIERKLEELSNNINDFVEAQ